MGPVFEAMYQKKDVEFDTCVAVVKWAEGERETACVPLPDGTLAAVTSAAAERQYGKFICVRERRDPYGFHEVATELRRVR